VFLAQHRDADMGIGEGSKFRGEAIGFMAEEHTDRKSGVPVEQVDGMNGCLDRCDFVAGLAHGNHHFQRLAGVFPRDRLLRAQSGLRDHILRGEARDTGEHELFQARSVPGSKEGSDVIQAADVFQQHTDRQRLNPFV